MFNRRKFITKVVSIIGGAYCFSSTKSLAEEKKVPISGRGSEAKRSLKIDSRYLNFPIRTGAKSQHLKMLVDGKTVREFDIELVDAQPEWWAFMDASEFQGKLVTLKIDKPLQNFKGLSSIRQSNEIIDAENIYHEKSRPQFHFSSRRGWLNDPNGLVYYKGEYHLFYQHNPYGWNWGNMHWGHAVSKDLVHWKELPIALYPDKQGAMFSGAAVIDWNNSTGFEQGQEKTMVAMFTAYAADTTVNQGLAFSNDCGRTWNKYDNNPVLPSLTRGNRDPKVIWYPPENKWVMVLYLDRTDPDPHPELSQMEIIDIYKDKNTFGFFSSSDLKKWEKMSEIKIPGDVECPEFFEIAVEENPAEKRWVLYAAKGFYLIGDFDGKVFSPESGPHTLQHGNCFYASQTFNNIPGADGRRILIPWGQNLDGILGGEGRFDFSYDKPAVYKEMPFNQMMGIPVSLTLRTTNEDLRLFSEPVEELNSLRNKSYAFENTIVQVGDNPLAHISGELFDITAEITPGDADEIRFMLRSIPIIYNAKKQILTCMDKSAQLMMKDGKITLRILVDRTSVDIFGNEGRLYMPMGVTVPRDNYLLSITVTGGDARIDAMEVFELKSAWV